MEIKKWRTKLEALYMIFDACIEGQLQGFEPLARIQATSCWWFSCLATSSLSPNTPHDVSIHADGHIFVYTRQNEDSIM